jgi:hypothetical protein
MGVEIYRNPSVEVAPLHNEVVLFDPQANRFCLLNATASFLWAEIEAPRSESDLAESVCRRFDGADMKTVSEDIQVVVSELLSLGYLQQRANGASSQLRSQRTDQRPAMPYERPRMRVMTDKEVLSAFQTTAAGTTMWWV